MFGPDPGPCLICGAPHCSCGGGPILVEQLPATASARASAMSPLGTLAAPAREATAVDPAPHVATVAERVQATLPPGHFTSGTYRRPKKARG
jgi:hypothetical protein